MAKRRNQPTAPRVRDMFGFELDADGLPLSGPERARRLAEHAKSNQEGDK